MAVDRVMEWLLVTGRVRVFGNCSRIAVAGISWKKVKACCFKRKMRNCGKEYLCLQDGRLNMEELLRGEFLSKEGFTVSFLNHGFLTVGLCT